MVASLVVAWSAWGFVQPVGPGAAAPDFTVRSTDGELIQLKHALEKGPVILYFTSTGCPVASKANPYYRELASAFKSTKVSFYAVVNAGEAETKAWALKRKLDFTCIPDGRYSIIKAFRVTKAPGCAVIGVDGTVLKYWDGWSKATLQAIARVVAAAARMTVPKLALKGASSTLEFG